MASLRAAVFCRALFFLCCGPAVQISSRGHGAHRPAGPNFNPLPIGPLALPDARKASGDGAKPAYGCQVTIQSEQERQMMKMQRREERKEKRRGRGPEEGEGPDAALPFDPREMRALR